MTISSATFVITDLATGAARGFALISSSARYLGVQWIGGDRIERRHAVEGAWLQIAGLISEGLPAAPLEADSPIVTALLTKERRAGLTVQYMASHAAELTPATTAEALDAQLRGLAAAA